ncbi:hypothetical protein SISSUDRAFT_1061062 [Sistotremastrum suecicum HHB10207 ss-3]|uniref:DUF6535 domain-containing protein n=1 Tax=Sistotremastrum suecicum HHB10207 ss-3 TaxID=1314776 RepID=A0A166EH51_9AGAM|nr:hypothetical protein SISSUDRAFT_1061062 [Sistotremastrum suecicum HHB10207 ss-3]
MAEQPSDNRSAGSVRPPSTTPSPAMSLSSLETKFDQLLSLIEKQTAVVEQQNTLMEKQHTEIKKELQDHGDKLETIRKDVLKNDQPYEPREVEDQQTWGGLSKEAVAITKEAAGEWTTLMNVSLVFNAIFLAIVTAFIVPVLQDLQTPSSDNSSGLFDPHRQEVIQQWIAFFQISAFSLSVFNSALCVLGTQWGARLITRIQAKDSHATAIQFERRKRSGKKWLLRLTGLLFSTLLLSIVLFMIAFLMQAWIVAYAQPEPRPILIAAAAIVSIMVLTILIIVGVTTYHAVCKENSPFETPLSNVIRLLLDKEPSRKNRLATVEDILETTEGDDQERSYRNEKGSGHTFHTETLKLYSSTVMNTTETDVLEKAVPSFRFIAWFEAPDALFPLFESVYQRFMATDTSIRVKETVDQHFLSFGKTIVCRWRPPKSEDTSKSTLLRWYTKKCEELCLQSTKLHIKYFPSFVAAASVREDNVDLRDISQLPYKECMRRVLASYDPWSNRSEVGDRLDVFKSAVIKCHSLLKNGRADDVIEIFSDQHSSILLSCVHSPLLDDRSADFVIGWIVRGRQVDLLKQLSEFIAASLATFSPEVINILRLLIPDSCESANFSIPEEFDLSRVLFSLFRTKPHPHYWSEQSRTLQFYLDHGAFDTISDLRAALVFFTHCVNEPDTPPDIRERAAFYLEEHKLRFSDSLEPPNDEHTSLVSDLCIFARDPSAAEFSANVTRFLDAFDRCHVHLLLDHPIIFSPEESSEILKSLI